MFEASCDFRDVPRAAVAQTKIHGVNFVITFRDVQPVRNDVPLEEGLIVQEVDVHNSTNRGFTGWLIVVEIDVAVELDDGIGVFVFVDVNESLTSGSNGGTGIDI